MGTIDNIVYIGLVLGMLYEEHSLNQFLDGFGFEVFLSVGLNLLLKPCKFLFKGLLSGSVGHLVLDHLVVWGPEEENQLLNVSGGSVGSVKFVVVNSVPGLVGRKTRNELIVGLGSIGKLLDVNLDAESRLGTC
jgi:hypothetical protein